MEAPAQKLTCIGIQGKELVEGVPEDLNHGKGNTDSSTGHQG